MTTPQTKVGLIRERTGLKAEIRYLRSLCEQAAAQMGECALTRRIRHHLYGDRDANSRSR